MSTTELLQFSPLRSFASPTFWHKLSEIKLDVDRLSDTPKTINGFYTNRNAKSCLLEVDYSSFNSNFEAPKFYVRALGTLYNKNTIDEFKDCDKNGLIQLEGNKLLEDFANDRVLEEPSILAKFFILSFADLKSHSYYYWFAFPCPLLPMLHHKFPAKNIKDLPNFYENFTPELISKLIDKDRAFFALNSDSWEVYSLKHLFQQDELWRNLDVLHFCFADPSEFQNPSWLMRIFCAFILFKRPLLVGKTLKFIGVRWNAPMDCGKSLLWEVFIKDAVDFENIKFVGWEPKANNKMGPRMVSMKESMDPVILAETSVNLNLRLMKWRLLPDLNLNLIADTKCLLFGAGTLGCAVARNLLGWGFKHISFIDSGKVSYGNPIRQYLYTFKDAQSGNAMKAEIAAERLKEINPNVISSGHVLQIPMPGHTIGESLLMQTTNELNTINELIDKHDVLFMLTDSRESRWLPTLLGAFHGKIVINAALGFDSYLVMRHGCHKDAVSGNAPISIKNIGDLKCIDGSDLGCYFCNDVTAPGNSLKDRTLDQQCTVTRPGVANIAASYAVELLVSILQHPLQGRAAAYYTSVAKCNDRVPEGLLGIIPHSIRGMMGTFENFLPATQKFRQCIACSEIVISKYREIGNRFLLNAFESTKYLENITGISDFAELKSEIIDFDDSDIDEIMD